MCISYTKWHLFLGRQGTCASYYQKRPIRLHTGKWPLRARNAHKNIEKKQPLSNTFRQMWIGNTTIIIVHYIILLNYLALLNKHEYNDYYFAFEMKYSNIYALITPLPTPNPPSKNRQACLQKCVCWGGGDVANVFKFTIDVNHDLYISTYITYMNDAPFQWSQSANLRRYEKYRMMDRRHRQNSCIYRIGKKINYCLFPFAFHADFYPTHECVGNV